MPAGRKPKTLNSDQIKEVETLGAFLTTEQMADYFGISRATFYLMMKRDPEIHRRYKKGRAKIIAMLSKSLVRDALDGSKPDRFFYLKCQAGWKENPKEDEPEPQSINIKISPDK